MPTFRVKLTRTIVRSEYYIVEADSDDLAMHIAENELVMAVTVDEPTYNTVEFDEAEEMP